MNLNDLYQEAMTTTSSNEQPDHTTTSAWMLWLIAGIALAFGAAATYFYYGQFHSYQLSQQVEHWGVFGDYIGGILNPIFGFFALIALLYTIHLQSKELAASREELRNSAQALRDSKDIAARQAEHFEIQAKKEDSYRMICQVFKELQEMHANEQKRLWVYLNTDAGGIKRMTARYFQLFGSQKKQSQYDGLVGLVEESSEGRANLDTFTPFINLLEELKQYMEYFEFLSNDYMLTDYYKRRYRGVICDLYEKGFIEVDLYSYYSS